MEVSYSTEQQPGRVFKNEFLEKLSKTSPTITFSTYGSIVGLFILLSVFRSDLSLIGGIGVFISGLFFWTFFEYIMHRFLFHLPNDSKWAQRFTYVMHGIHHEFPRDKQRIFMPPAPGILIITFVFGLFYLALGEYSFAFAAGWLTGYVIYAFVHYHVHVSKPHKLFRHLWTNHALHHYKYQDKAYGVTTSFWDRVFFTLPPKNTLNKL